MAVETKNTKFFYPPRPGNGAGTFSDNIVGLQTVEGGGLTQGNFEFTTGVTEKVNRTFNVGAFSELMSLDMMGIDSLEESRRILATQFRVYPNYDISQVLGERDLVEKFGIGVPFYGPVGIGAGIFTGAEDAAISPPDIKFLPLTLSPSLNEILLRCRCKSSLSLKHL